VPLALTKLDDLDFGTVVSSSSSGTVSIAADGSGQSVTGGVTPLASAPGARAVFAGAGSLGEQVSIFLAPPANLSDGAGHNMPISLGLETTSVFVMPPSFNVLEQRLRGRSKDDEAAIQRRLQVARDEVTSFTEYDFIVINDELDAAVERLSSIVVAERLRIRRMRETAETIVRTFI